jgi:hypothetical protein
MQCIIADDFPIFVEMTFTDTVSASFEANSNVFSNLGSIEANNELLEWISACLAKISSIQKSY